MANPISLPERLYGLAMWVLSLILAGFMISLGGLVLKDLPLARVEIRRESFLDEARFRAATAQKEVDEKLVERLDKQAQGVQSDLDKASQAYQSAKASFDNWVATRVATGLPTQDEDLLARTRELDRLKVNEDAARAANVAALARLNEARQAIDRDQNAIGALWTQAEPDYRRAKFFDELKIFLWRLLLTVPLLVIAGWMAIRKRKSRFWPVLRAFIVFALFVFFVELVPFLPEYGGYVRASIGVALTLAVIYYSVQAMHKYLQRRAALAQEPPSRWRHKIRYEDALKKFAARTCPRCERSFAPGQADLRANTRSLEHSNDIPPADYCMHCGTQLFDHCSNCQARKFTLFHYCMRCGTKAEVAAPIDASLEGATSMPKMP